MSSRRSRSDRSPREVLPGWAGIVVLDGVVEEVPPSEQPTLGSNGRQGLGNAGQHSGVFSSQHLIAVEIAPVGQDMVILLAARCL